METSLNPTDFAAKAGISVPYASQILGGKRAPSRALVDVRCTSLGARISGPRRAHAKRAARAARSRPSVSASVEASRRSMTGTRAGRQERSSEPLHTGLRLHVARASSRVRAVRDLAVDDLLQARVAHLRDAVGSDLELPAVGRLDPTLVRDRRGAVVAARHRLAGPTGRGKTPCRHPS